jgi:5-methylcytosine-specific restriction enzyme subunit McrC
MTGVRISLREYGRLYVGEFDPAKPSVTAEQAAFLTGLKPVYGFDVFKWTNRHTITAQQYVGTVQVGGLTIDVLPKIEGAAAAASDTAVRHNLVAMLLVALDLDIGEGDMARIAVQRQGILDILIRLFCDKLFAQVHRGLVRRYEAQEGQLAVLRGRLGVTEQVRLNAANSARLFCRFDEFQADNPLNRVFKAALRLLLRVAKNLENQRRLAELLLAFEEVADIRVASLPWHQVGFDRLNERYRPAFRLAELFLKRTAPDVTGGRAAGFSLFFDMNSLFEEYVGRVAVRVFRFRRIQVRLQGPQRFLAVDESGGANAFAMRPDAVGTKHGQVAWIIDTKWKQLSPEEAREGASQSDLYQMYAYANNYGCGDVVLLYPHYAALGAHAGTTASYRLQTPVRTQVGFGVARIRTATIDLSDLKSVPSQLLALFPDRAQDAEAA